MSRSLISSRRPSGLRAAAALLALAVFASTLVGCGPPAHVEWVPDGKPQSLADAERTARDADTSYASGTDPEDAPALRTQVLVWLRQQGPDGERAAVLLTEGFPAEVRAVPVRVEIASVEGTRSLIVVEATTTSSGRLDGRRLWVFEMESGRLVRSTSFR